MSPVQEAWRDYRDAVRHFSPPARAYLTSELLAWTGSGIFQVLFNLYLVEGGFREAFVGTAVSTLGLSLALCALPSGILADRWGRRNCLMLGAALDGAGLIARALFLDPGVILGASFLAGAGQSMLAIAAAPFITEHSTPRERTHLFSTFFACSLLAGVLGSVLGGALPWLLLHLPDAFRPSRLVAFRITLLAGGAFGCIALLPLARLRHFKESALAHVQEAAPPDAVRRLYPIALNFALIGMGAGLVIPFMNLYFADRFHCSSAQIGVYFAVAQVFTALAALLGPMLARRFGMLRTAIGSELLSLPFLVTLGAETHLSIAVGAYWMRATLMQAATPLLQNFVMEVLPPSLRARATSIGNLLWNLGWAVSATSAGLIIQRFGYAVPFYMTAALYATAAVTFYLAFRRVKESAIGPPPPRAAATEEALGARGEGALTE